MKGPFYTRHNQEAYVEAETIRGSRSEGFEEGARYAWGYIIGTDGEKHKFAWYICGAGSEMPYIAEADYPSGHDLFRTKRKDLTWSESRYAANGRHPL